MGDRRGRRRRRRGWRVGVADEHTVMGMVSVSQVMSGMNTFAPAA